MHQALFVRVPQGVEQVREQGLHLRLRQTTSLGRDVFFQGDYTAAIHFASAHQLHAQPDTPIRLPEVVHFHDAGMRHARHGPSLVAKASLRSRVAHHLLADYLESVSLAQGLVLHLVDFSHAASTEQSFHAEVPEGRSGLDFVGVIAHGA